MNEKADVKESYVKPQVLATYTKDELAETIRPHGFRVGYADNDGGCACGCGCSIVP